MIELHQLTTIERKTVAAREATLTPRNLDDCLLLARDDYHAMRRALAHQEGADLPM